MKKSNKKIPKTYLPKFGNGGEGGDATSNLYNEKRGINQTSDAQYMAAAGALAQGGANMANVYGDGQSTNRQKADSFDQTARATTSAINPVIGAAIGVGDMIGDPIRADLEATDPVTGKVKNRQNVKTGAVVGMFADPGKWIGHIANGGLNDLSGNKYVDDIEANAQAEIAANKLAQEEQAKQQAAYQQQQNDYINNAIQAGMTNYQQQPKGASIQYPMGGMNMQPNAEIEKQENVVAPNGGFLQADGPPHSQGGVPVALPGNSMIFSDKLKLGKKTFADLNKVNNTNKEDKILESNKYGSTSKSTAELMKMAKNKNSEALFNAQEALKQSKVEAYAKKLGVTLPQTSQTPQQEFAMGGVKLPMYPYGTITPEQYKQAQTDSMTLYNAGLKSNKIPAYEYPGAREAAARLTGLNNRTPTPIKGQFYGQQPDYTGSYHTEFKKPTMIPYREASLEDSKKVPVVNHPNYNQYIPGIEKSVQLGNIEQYEHGGRKLPKYEFGKLTPEDDQLGYVPRNQVDKMRMQQATLNNQNKQFNSSAWSPEELQASSDALVEESYNDTPITNSTPASTINQANSYPIRRDKNGKLIFDTPSTNTTNSNYNQEAYDAELARMNAAGGRGKKETNWKNTLGQVGNFAAQNAGNIYDLINRKKNEVEKYDRLKPSYLDPTASLRDAQMQANRAEYNVRGASGGNAGTYLSNRVALNAQNTINKDRIRKEYANINAGISNQIGQYNNELSRAEVIANAQNRAVNDNIRRQAIGSLGSNFGQASLANKKGEMDQSMMDMLPKMINDPAFKKYYEEWAKKNG
jgi:hypothetical protein